MNLDELEAGLRRELEQASLDMAQSEVQRRHDACQWAARGLEYVADVATVRAARRTWEGLQALALEAGVDGDVETAEVLLAMARYLGARQYGAHGLDRLADLGLSLGDVESPPAR